MIPGPNLSSHKFHFGLAEFALAQIQGHAGLAYKVKKFTYVIQMALSILRAHPNIVNIGVGKITNGSQHRSNSTDECGTSVLESEWHPKPLVETIVRHECRQPAVFFRQRDLPVARLRIECTDESSFADTAQHFVDGRHRVSVTDRKRVQISVIAGNAHTTVLLCHAHDRTRHQTVRRLYQTFVEQVLDLAVDLRFECVWHMVGRRLPWHQPLGGLDSINHRVAFP